GPRTTLPRPAPAAHDDAQPRRPRHPRLPLRRLHPLGLRSTPRDQSPHRGVRNEHPTPNTQHPTSNIPLPELERRFDPVHWMLDVGCWTLDVGSCFMKAIAAMSL